MGQASDLAGQYSNQPVPVGRVLWEAHGEGEALVEGSEENEAVCMIKCMNIVY